MSHSHPHDLHREVRRYLIVFGCLLVGTILTVAAYYLHLSNVVATVVVALFIASVKGMLVAGYFMHLISERKMIYGILAATIFFVGGLMYLTVWSMQPTSLVHIKNVS